MYYFCHTVITYANPQPGFPLDTQAAIYVF